MENCNQQLVALTMATLREVHVLMAICKHSAQTLPKGTYHRHFAQNDRDLKVEDSDTDFKEELMMNNDNCLTY